MLGYLQDKANLFLEKGEVLILSLSIIHPWNLSMAIFLTFVCRYETGMWKMVNHINFLVF